MIHLERRDTPGRKTDDQVATTPAHRSDRLVECIPTHGIEYELDTCRAGDLEDLFPPSLLRIVQRITGAVLDCQLPLVSCASTRDHASAHDCSNLGCGQSNRTGGTENENPIVARKAAALLQRVECCAVRRGKSCRLHETQIRRDAQDTFCWKHQLLRKAPSAIIGNTDDAFAGSDVLDSFASLQNYSCDLGSRYPWQGRLCLVLALHLERIREVDTGRVYRDPYFSGAGRLELRVLPA